MIVRGKNTKRNVSELKTKVMHQYIKDRLAS